MATGDATHHDGQIGLFSCIAFAVGTMVGAGAFVLSGPAIGAAGPAALISFGMAGVAVLFSALSFAIVSRLAPAGGSGFFYVGEALGSYWGFITSWAFYLSIIVSVAFVSSGFGVYLHQFFLQMIPAKILTIIAAFALTLLNLGPASLVGKAEGVLVSVKISILGLLAIFGLWHIGFSDFAPFAPHGWAPVFSQSGQLFLAYLGFSVVTSIAGDVKDANRTVPLAILLSMLIVFVVYGGVVIALLSANLPSYGESSLGSAARVLMGHWGGLLVIVAALLSTLSSANANILGASEMMVRLAAKREVPTIFGHLWNGHPAGSVFVGAIIYFTLLWFGELQSTVSLANVGAISMMLLVNLAAFRAIQSGKVFAGSKKGLAMIFPVLGFSLAFFQLTMIPMESIAIGLALVFAGSAFYLSRRLFHHPASHKQAIEHLSKNNGPTGRALRDMIGVRQKS